MYCKHCGRSLQPGAEKCPGCGKPVLLYKDGTGFRDLQDPDLRDLAAEKPNQKIPAEERKAQQSGREKRKKSAVPLLIISNFILLIFCLVLIILLLLRGTQEENITHSTVLPTAESTEAVTAERPVPQETEVPAPKPESKNEAQPPLASIPVAPPDIGAIPETTVPAVLQNTAEAGIEETTQLTEHRNK